jgi:TRAP-type uncharacterized transport system fused permease subunit
MRDHKWESEPKETADAQKILEKVDREQGFRKELGWLRPAVTFLCVGLTLFQLYTAFFGTLQSQLQRAPHLTIALALIFILYPWRKGRTGKGVPWYDLVLATMALGTGAYHVIYYEELVNRFLYSNTDIAVAIIGVLLTLEGARRVVGLPLTIVASAALLYAYFGPYMPGFAQHQGFDVERISTFMFLGSEAILGIPIAISSTFIFLFLFFGVILRYTGVSRFFNDLAFAITKRMVGGPAKAAVMASAFQGMVTGSSVANTVGSGSFTIPMMKKAGYRPEFAAAVEASASTGGQLMPPIMGAAAFLMIEFTGISYGEIALAALVPAILYFAGIFIAVHLESKRIGVLGMQAEATPPLKVVLLKQGYLLLPLLAIIGVLISGQSPIRAALIAILMAVTVSLFQGVRFREALSQRWYLLLPLLLLMAWMLFPTAMPAVISQAIAVKSLLLLLLVGVWVQQWIKGSSISLRDVITVMEEGARTALGVIVACGAAGIIVGVVTLTGIGLKMAGGIIGLAGGVLLFTMFFTMIACILLGMGVPTTANYVIMATMAAPALLAFDVGGMEIPIIAAHLFVFYFGIVADITPPVALAAYAGSGIAKSNPFRTGVTATKVAIGAFLIPYIFVYNPVLVLEGATWWSLPLAFCTALIGMLGVSAAMMGYFRTHARAWERVFLFAGGLILIVPDLVTDGVGLAVLVLLYLIQGRRKASGDSPSLPA